MKRKRIELKMQVCAVLERFRTTGIHSVRLVNRAKIIFALDPRKSIFMNCQSKKFMVGDFYYA